jgi:hypothetical protein
VSGSSGLAWSAGKGIVAARRRADEAPGAGQGFRPLRFAAPAGSGASGGLLVDSQDALLGIITKASCEDREGGGEADVLTSAIHPPRG